MNRDENRKVTVFEEYCHVVLEDVETEVGGREALADTC